MRSRAELEAQVASGHVVTFVFFWGHTPAREDVVDASCLSQWFPRGFTREGVEYATAEHYMMATKAKVFGDAEMLEQILRAKSPSEAKALGRRVRGFDGAAWERVAFDAVVEGNVAKFGAHADLATFLVGTGDRVLVEASPQDAIWGIGLDASNPDAREPSRWRGRNLLGFALMEVRDRLRTARE